MPAAATWAAPLRLLTEPLAAWDALKLQPSLLPAFVYHTVVIALTWLLNAQLYSEVAVAAAIGPAKAITSYALVAIIVQSLVSVAVLTLLLAAVVWLVTRLFAPGSGFRRCWVLALNGSLPLAVGWIYGSLLFFFVKPLATDFLTAMSLLIKPFSLGMSTFVPGGFEALSLPWFFATYFDLFGIWTILIMCGGLVRFLGLDPRKLFWAALTLVLLLLLLITGLWQVVQMGITSAI